MIVEIMFYIALLICTATVIVVAVKGFQELMAPIRAERPKSASRNRRNPNPDP